METNQIHAKEWFCRACPDGLRGDMTDDELLIFGGNVVRKALDNNNLIYGLRRYLRKWREILRVGE